jgi:hypothetical protein
LQLAFAARYRGWRLATGGWQKVPEPGLLLATGGWQTVIKPD